ncbi:MAG: tripartite tricarboxylate transporter TctB family protein [Armatimonadota bacterium]|nr:tripartite tricarboxylate transporter TctB family protein [Armatimonadota bacterium]
MTAARQGVTDVVSGLTLLAVAGVGLRALAGTTRALAGFDFGTDPGPALMPRLLLWALGAGGVWLTAFGAWRLARSRRQPRAGPVARPSDLAKYAIPAAFALSLAVYVWGLFAAGFVAVTVVFCFFWIAALSRQGEGRLGWRRALTSAGAAVAIAAAVYYVFKGFVRVPLP